MKNIFIIVIGVLFVIDCYNLKAQEAKNDIQTVFSNFIELNNELLNTQKKLTYDTLVKYNEKEFYPALKIFEDTICSEFDSVLFASFINLLLSSKNSADEIPVNTLGAVFICQTSKTECFIKMMSKGKQHSYILNILEFGFLNEINDKDIDFSKQKQVLETLKKY